MNDKNLRNNVKDFYNQVGWQTIGETLYQNAQYEDLRPVSQAYLHRCHMRVKRHLAQAGTYFLDAGSGPVQYPEYLTYSEGYQARVCMDISIVALKEARKRLGEHGLYVLGDITHLPFKSDVFDGISALHTIHHVPMHDKSLAYGELYRTLKPDRSMVVVDGWTNAFLMERSKRFMAGMQRLRGWWEQKIKKDQKAPDIEKLPSRQSEEPLVEQKSHPAGTFVQKFDADGLIELLKGKMDFEILVWRSVSVAFMRAVIYPDWGGRFWLKVLFWIEERFPQLLGRIGQYPLVVIYKPSTASHEMHISSEV
jgi:ubiquinone/menaquinone biosynthesis C-methylase UbiE